MSGVVCCGVLCCVVLCCVVLCRVVLYCVVLCCVVLCCVVLCCVVLCCVVLCCVVLCCVVLCCVVLCCVVLCCGVLRCDVWCGVVCCGVVLWTRLFGDANGTWTHHISFCCPSTSPETAPYKWSFPSTGTQRRGDGPGANPTDDSQFMSAFGRNPNAPTMLDSSRGLDAVSVGVYTMAGHCA